MLNIVKELIGLLGWQTVMLWVLQHLLGTAKGSTAFNDIAPIVEQYIAGGSTPAAPTLPTNPT